MGKGKLEELELSWVKAEGKELGKSKKQKARSSKVILLPPEEDCQLYQKKKKTWCLWLSSPQGVGLALKWN